MNTTLDTAELNAQAGPALSDSPSVPDLPSAPVEPSLAGVSSKQPGAGGASFTISFTPDGAARCIYSDIIPLQELGRLKVQRASAIEFREDRQQWAVIMDGETQPRFYHRSREACLQWEREYVNNTIHADTA